MYELPHTHCCFIYFNNFKYRTFCKFIFVLNTRVCILKRNFWLILFWYTYILYTNIWLLTHSMYIYIYQSHIKAIMLKVWEILILYKRIIDVLTNGSSESFLLKFHGILFENDYYCYLVFELFLRTVQPINRRMYSSKGLWLDTNLSFTW